MTSDEVAAAVEHAHRSEWARVLAGVASLTGDLDLAEEATAEAFAAAVASWRETGVPPNPGGWLQTTARRKALDRLRRAAVHERKIAELESELARTTAAPDSPIPDERLELIFCCCHPAFAPEAQVALTLRCVAGLTVGEIARAFVVPEQTMAKRLVRAKQKIRLARVPLRVPSREELPDRLPAVLAVVYLIFNEGYASGSADLVRTDLCARAVDLGRLLAVLLPDDPEVLGLLALMLLHESRRPARLDADGAPVLLPDQDRTQWDAALAAEARRLLERARRAPAWGRYVIEASIAAEHAGAGRYESTDWQRIVGLYDLLLRVAPTAVVALNRAIAVGFASGPDAGLAELDGLAGQLDRYHYFHAARADLLQRSGRGGAAAEAYRAALALATNPAEQDFLRSRLSGAPDVGPAAV